MIDMANNLAITKVSRVFLKIYAYTPAVARGLPGPTLLVRQPGNSIMRKLIDQVIPTILAAALLTVTPALRAQNQITTRIVPVPDGAFFSVDGQSYQHTASFFWPQGSKHTLQAPDFAVPSYKTKFLFQNWQWSGGSMTGNAVTITADPAIPQYSAVFVQQYAVDVKFNPCDPAAPCFSPGSVSMGGSAISSDQEIYVTAGSTIVFQAVPNPGYVFVGWAAGTAQVINGFQNTVTVNSPTVVVPIFAPARPVHFTTIPPNFSILADRTLVPTPSDMDWGYGTVHSLAPVSPQRDSTGAYWVFSSWSDGGAAVHAYTVAGLPTGDTITATFIPGVAVNLSTSPAGLSLTVDGRVNWPSYFFTWGTGETHNIQVPAQQTDSAGHVWQFASWSDGGAMSHAYTVPSDAATVVSGVRLVATYSPMGHMVINSPVAGLTVQVDGAACAVPCDIVRPTGTQVVVSAPVSIPAGAGSRQDFSGWSTGGQGNLTMTLTGSDLVTVSANYRVMNYLSASANPRGSVNFNLQPSSSDGYYDAQTKVNVTAAAVPGYRFRAWNGDLAGTQPSGTLSMDAPHSIMAMMDRVPYLAPTAVANAVGVTPQSGVAPGSIISIFGASLATDTVVGQGSPLTQTLGGVTAHIGDRLLPLFFVSPGQINAQLPSDMSAGQQTLTVSAPGQSDVQSSFTVAQDAPGLFSQMISGVAFAVAMHADGSPVTPSSPAVPGETITVYGTGFGATNPVRPVGFAVPATPEYTLLDTPAVQLGSAAMPLVDAFAVGGSIGLDAVLFTIGDGAPSATNAQLTITVNGQQSNTLFLPMQ